MKGLKAEKKYTAGRWKDLKSILRTSGLDVAIYPDEMFVKIEGDDKADIELFPTPTGEDEGFVFINLWYYEFNSKTLEVKDRKRKQRYSTIPDALMGIHSILEDVQLDMKQPPNSN